MKKSLIAIFSVLFFASCKQQPKTDLDQNLSQQDSGYEFVGGYPTEATIQKAYDDADLNRAIQAYRFFLSFHIYLRYLGRQS